MAGNWLAQAHLNAGARLCSSLAGAEERLVAALVHHDMAALLRGPVPEEHSARMDAGLACIESLSLPRPGDLSARLSVCVVKGVTRLQCARNLVQEVDRNTPWQAPLTVCATPTPSV